MRDTVVSAGRFVGQAVARKDGHRLAMGHMEGRAAAPEVVVVQRGQVVVDEAERMDHLDRRRRRQTVFKPSADRVAARHDQHRTQPFSRPKKDL